MALDQGIIRFDPEGPPGQGLEPMVEITPDMLVEGSASERCHNYYTSPSGLLTAGVWKCTAHTLEFGPYPVDEFMLVLDGSVNIVHEDGHEEIFRAGDAFVIPKGLPCQWKQTESIHKIYVILDDPETPIPDQPASNRAIRLSASEGLKKLELSNPENFEGGTPTQEDCSAFEDTTDRFFRRHLDLQSHAPQGPALWPHRADVPARRRHDADRRHWLRAQLHRARRPARASRHRKRVDEHQEACESTTASSKSRPRPRKGIRSAFSRDLTARSSRKPPETRRHWELPSFWPFPSALIRPIRRQVAFTTFT